jgi:hypothetical protein
VYTLRFHVDGGSNCNLLADLTAASLAAITASSGMIGGLANGLSYTGVATTHNTFGSSHEHPASIAFLHTPSGTRNILSESVLLEQYGIEARKNPPHLIFADGSTLPMQTVNGLYYVDLNFHSGPPTALAAHVRADDAALMWAARLGTSADELPRLSRAVKGVNLDTLSSRQREAIASNVHRAIAQQKHAPTSNVPTRDRASQPAEMFICDGFGKHHGASPIDKAVYQFSAVDEYSSFGYIASGTTHTIDDWVNFIRTITLDARSHGHKPVRVRFDRAPELRSDELKQRLEKELGLIVEITPREHHEGVGRAERNHDLLTRMGEEMCQRCGLGTNWLLPARSYAQWLLNRKVMTNQTETRYQRYTRSVPDLTSPIPYTFGTTVAIVEDVRGPKGSLDHPRGSIGKFVGISGSSHLVYRPQRGTTVHQHHVTPLNELALIRSSLPASSATAEGEAQTEGNAGLSDSFADVVERFRAASAATTAPPPPAPSPPTVNVPVGQHIDVLWPLAGGKGNAWYTGKVIDFETQKNGKRRHHVEYPGWPTIYRHDLASDDHEWKLVDAPTPQPADTARISSRTRSRALANIAEALEATSLAATAETLECLLYQQFGDAAAPPAATTAEEAITALAAEATLFTVPIFDAHRSFTTLKATQNLIEVATDMGPQQLRVPSTYTQVLKSAQKDAWIAADQKALNAILALPGNRLVSRDIPANHGLVIAPCVTQRKLKIDQATGRLAATNPYKSRHCVDGGRATALARRNGSPADNETSSAVADDLTSKCVLADAAVRNRNLTKCDVPDAYVKGKRIGRPRTYMELPKAFNHYKDDDGSGLCIELTTPLWGENEAGFEWQIELESRLRAIGWQRAENVPAMWRFTSPDGDAVLITIVDDLLISESESSGYSITDRTIALLEASYGTISHEREPTSFTGFTIRRERARRLIQLTVQQKINEAVLEFIPELRDPATAPSLPSGNKLQTLADALTMPTERPDKLTRDQTRTQQLIGVLKFIEKLHPRITLTLHRLSCVMCCPPPEAWVVACAALADTYREQHVGISYGGLDHATSPRLGGRLDANIPMDEPAVSELEGHGDATWGDRIVYGIIITFAGGAVFHQTKKIALIVDSSMESEAIASSKTAETVSYAREILRALGIPPEGPTLIGTDNLANQRVATTVGCPTRSKHFLRRYGVLQQRIQQGECILKHVKGVEMPADFLTKWIGRAQLERALTYATNSLYLNKPK